MNKSLLRSSLVLFAALLLAGTFLWAELRTQRPVASARVSESAVGEASGEWELWADLDVALNVEEDGHLPKPIRIVAKVLGLSDEQVEALIKEISERHAAIAPLNEERRANNQAIRELLDSGGDVAEKIGMLVLANHDLGMQIGALKRESLDYIANELLTEDQRRRLGAVRRAHRLQPVIPAFRALGLLGGLPRGDKEG